MNIKYQKYLPSRKFTVIMLFSFLVLLGIFILFFIFSGKESFFGESKNNLTLSVQNQTVNDLIRQDGDSDGISDWEEALWGTDKTKNRTFDDTPDSVYIENKKKELNVEQSVNVAKLTETEKFAREFFASFSAMKASGGVDPSTINGFSNALGQKIVNPDLLDAYSETDVKLTTGESSNSAVAKLKYYGEVQKLFQSYQESGVGDELEIVNNGLASSGVATENNEYDRLPVIALAYQDFAKKMMEVSVPSELVTLHLQIANSSNNTGISVKNMAEIIIDPLVGLQGISQYQKYSEDLISAVADLETMLVEEEL